MSEQQLREQLQASFKNRAVLYYMIFDELRQELGAERAEELLKRAIYRRGQQLGQRYAEYGPRDFSGLEQAFLSRIPDEGRLFAPAVQRSDQGQSRLRGGLF